MLVKRHLENVFHGTTAHAVAPDLLATHSEVYQWLRENRPAVANRVKRELCGHKDCTCGVVRES